MEIQLLQWLPMLGLKLPFSLKLPFRLQVAYECDDYMTDETTSTVMVEAEGAPSEATAGALRRRATPRHK